MDKDRIMAAAMLSGFVLIVNVGGYYGLAQPFVGVKYLIATTVFWLLFVNSAVLLGNGSGAHAE